MRNNRTPLPVGTEVSPITWFIRRLIFGAFLYFLSMPVMAFFIAISTPLSVGTGVPLPIVSGLLTAVVGGLLLRALYR